MYTLQPEPDQKSYHEHLAIAHANWRAALADTGYDTAVVLAGTPTNYHEDDQGPPFRANPHFSQWLPGAALANSALVINTSDSPTLYFYQPADYWHKPPELDPHIQYAADQGHINVRAFDTQDALMKALLSDAHTGQRVAWLAETHASNERTAELNPAGLVARLHYARAIKDPFEVACMRLATSRAVAGHLAAAEAFARGDSEFATHMAYLAASGQTGEDLPYSSIVAQNQHAAVLHYQHYARNRALPLHTLLIDAGGTGLGYASDITRTYHQPLAPETLAAANAELSQEADDVFALLLRGMEALQLGIIEEIAPGRPYPDLHQRTHERLAGLLVECGIAKGSPEELLASNVTRTFLPHGLGHLIGLQTHDVGGHQSSPEGGLLAPPERDPALRLTRVVEKDQIFTIEPGCYFVPMLLDELRSGSAAHHVDWRLVDALIPYGGIRIEDNVRVLAGGVENLTRDAFAAHTRSKPQSAAAASS